VGSESSRLPDIVAVDEAQFFGPGLVPEIAALLGSGVQVEVAGLCVTYDGGPFAPPPPLLAMAEEVVERTAGWHVCGADAAFHGRLSADGTPALSATAAQGGGAESYQARCRRHRRAAESPQPCPRTARGRSCRYPVAHDPHFRPGPRRRTDQQGRGGLP